MSKFTDIAYALNMSRGSGKTYQTLVYAPSNKISRAMVLCHNQEYAKIMQGELKHVGREDLKIVVAQDDNLKGLRGIFVADHSSVSAWLNEAQSLIDKQSTLIKSQADEILVLKNREMQVEGMLARIQEKVDELLEQNKKHLETLTK